MSLIASAPRRRSRLGSTLRMLLTCNVLPFVCLGVLSSAPISAQTAAPAPANNTLPEGKLFSPEQLTGLLPASVYFQGKTASLQLRNTAGLHFTGKSILWAGLVDTSGYASDIQERYEFYLVTEGPLRIGSYLLPPGAYGAGFPGGHFLIMDIGGHTLVQGPTQELPRSVRPRPLQILATAPDTVNLCLRRQCVTLRALANDAH